MALDLREFVHAGPKVSDGAWGTQLQQRGLPVGSCPELWNADNPAGVEEVARAYVEAGSDVILSNTFGGNRFVLAGDGAADRVSELVEAGVAISRKAAGDAAKVFASVGPTGKIVMMGEVTPEEYVQAFGEAVRAAARGGADAIVLETFNELDEAKLALEAATGACDLPVIVSMTFDSGPDKTRTMMGNSPADLVAMATEGGAAAVGANCGVGPDNYIGVAALLRAETDLPIWIKANAGLPIADAQGNTTFPMGPEEFAGYAPKLVEAGANFVGGCCGTTPEHIRQVCAVLA